MTRIDSMNLEINITAEEIKGRIAEIWQEGYIINSFYFTLANPAWLDALTDQEYTILCEEIMPAFEQYRQSRKYKVAETLPPEQYRLRVNLDDWRGFSLESVSDEEKK